MLYKKSFKESLSIRRRYLEKSKIKKGGHKYTI